MSGNNASSSHPRVPPLPECNICLEVYSTSAPATSTLDHRPRGLPCGHTICTECGISQMKQKAECPLCRTPIRATSINEIALNYALMEMIQQQQKQHGSHSASSNSNPTSRSRSSSSSSCSSSSRPISSQLSSLLSQVSSCAQDVTSVHLLLEAQRHAYEISVGEVEADIERLCEFLIEAVNEARNQGKAELRKLEKEIESRYQLMEWKRDQAATVLEAVSTRIISAQQSLIADPSSSSSSLLSSLTPDLQSALDIYQQWKSSLSAASLPGGVTLDAKGLKTACDAIAGVMRVVEEAPASSSPTVVAAGSSSSAGGERNGNGNQAAPPAGVAPAPVLPSSSSSPSPALSSSSPPFQWFPTCLTQNSFVLCGPNLQILVDRLASWLPTPNPGSRWHARLLYRASSHGWIPSMFHERCDGRKNTLIVAKVNTSHPTVIGGFAAQAWNSSKEGVNVFDDTRTSFLFSLVNKSTAPIKFRLKSSLSDGSLPVATRWKSSSGPIFGGEQANSRQLCDLVFSANGKSAADSSGNCLRKIGSPESAYEVSQESQLEYGGQRLQSILALMPSEEFGCAQLEVFELKQASVQI